MSGTNGGDPAADSRIVETATKLYGERGFGATLDEIAAAAHVSRAALDRHFPTEVVLREAINERVMIIAAEILAAPPARTAEEFDDLADRVTRLVHEHPYEVRYVARGAVEGTPDGLATFDAFMAFALASFQEMADNEVLDPSLDVDWAALHVVIFNLATVLFQRAIDQHLPDSLMTEAGVERWHEADTELFRRGFLRRDLPTSA